MSVAVPVIDSIDGSLRRIYLKEGVDAFHWIEDIYREVINQRSSDEGLRKWFPFLKADGNNAKGGGKFTPRYVTMLQGCRVIPYDENILIVVTGEAITDNADIDPDPFDTSTRTNALKLYITPPAAEIVRDVEALAAISRMSFDQKISIDAASGYDIATFTGDPALLGNVEYPVDNFVDAVILANNHSLHTLYFHNDNILSTADISGFSVEGSGSMTSKLNVIAASTCDRIHIEHTTISGDLDGDINIERCVVNGLNYFNGGIRDCQITNEPIVLFGSTPARFLTCRWAMAAGAMVPSVIDCNNETTPLIMTEYIGYLKIINRTTDTIATINFNGIIEVDSSCTAGTFMFSGNGRVIDHSTGTCIVDDSLVVNAETISDYVWNEILHEHSTKDTSGYLLHNINFVDTWVYVDTELGDVGEGTSDNPFNNFPDAVDFCESRGWKQIKVLSDATIDRNLKNFVIEGVGGLPVISLNGQNVDKSEFTKVKLSGQQVGQVTCREVILLGGMTGVNGVYKESGIVGNISMADGAKCSITASSSLLMSVAQPHVVDMGVGFTNVVLNMRKFSGSIKVINMDHTSKLVTLAFASGHFELDNTNTLGNVKVAGIPDSAVVNTSVMTIDSGGLLPSSDTITEDVWSYER